MPIPTHRLNTGARTRAALLALVVPAATAAQTPRDPAAPRDSGGRRVDAVLVRGARAPEIVGGAAAVVVRPAALPIPTPPAPSLEEALRRAPFVLVRQNSRGEVELSMRGSESRQTGVLVDGLPLTIGWDHRSDPSLVPLTGVRTITIVRGLASLLEGPNTLGGVIAFGYGSTSSDAAGATADELTLGAGVDQYGARVLSGGVGVPVGTRAGTLLLRAGAAHRARTGFALPRDGGAGDGVTGGGADRGRAGAGELRSNSDLRQTDGFAAVRLQSDAGAHLGLTATAYQARRGVPAELHVRRPRFWRYPEAGRSLAVLSAGTGTRRTALGMARVDASAGVVDGTMRLENFASGAYDRVVSREGGDERTATARVLAAHSLPGGGELRAAYTRSEVRYDETLGVVLDTATARRYRQRLQSAGVEAQWTLLGRAQVSGGVVRDAAETPAAGGRPLQPALAAWGWRAGATTTALDDGVRLHASASRRARFPALRELYSGAIDRFEPSPGLRPERLIGLEAGATLLGGPLARAGAELQAVAFHHRLHDAVVRVAGTGRAFRRINRDEVRSTGLELLGGWSSARADADGAARGVALTGDLLVQRVRVRDPLLAGAAATEQRPEHQPAVRGSAMVGVPVALGVRAAAGGRFTGRQLCVHPDLARQVDLAAQAVADAALTRAWGARAGGARGGRLRHVRATLALDNVGNATVYDQCGLPQPGRTLRLGLELF